MIGIDMIGIDFAAKIMLITGGLGAMSSGLALFTLCCTATVAASYRLHKGSSA